eukprot:CAMPEP_0117578610 /NCGR_PEP_ID=MMETSP0784-20121206/64116_1 /TAXON_ID=39447 /ORGANISM="" /LENGTH=42 /DNA_ID= /DNA_START= /DNA_END= /DNA_ORIENTATION=
MAQASGNNGGLVAQAHEIDRQPVGSARRPATRDGVQCELDVF